MEPHAQQTLSNLFGAMAHKGSEENEYIMKSIMRTMSLLEEKMVPFVEIVVTSLTEKLLLVAKVRIRSVSHSVQPQDFVLNIGCP